MITAENMLRVGIVSSVDDEKKVARVYFPDAHNMVSDWLYVLQYPAWTYETDTYTEYVEHDTELAGRHRHYIQPHIHHIAPHLHHIAPHLHHINPHLHHIAPHLHHIPLHTHTNEVSKVSLITNAAGGHTHTLRDQGGTVSTTSADSVADHTHSIDAHNHVVTIHETEWDTEPTEHDTETTEHDTETTEHDTETTEHDTEPTAHYTDYEDHHKHHINPHRHYIKPHQHRTGYWMPAVNDRVLVLMACGYEMDGYIMGVIGREPVSTTDTEDSIT